MPSLSRTDGLIPFFRNQYLLWPCFDNCLYSPS
uniref:Uncharacterized protein n=1 Tax=Myoviridae sp. ctgXa1 TaxID=2827700 RepID=A0A8S5T6X2_9CAUD|nr:MAG TPA: hypothetical protein [Myoviridae sp. ctgXa1]DAL79245.1 MAG TPA: hypothetical protein [Caudoviricetes sp.]